MRKFAKLYETELGQILVMRIWNNSEPEIACTFDPQMDGVNQVTISSSGYRRIGNPSHPECPGWPEEGG